MSGITGEIGYKVDAAASARPRIGMQILSGAVTQVIQGTGIIVTNGTLTATGTVSVDATWSPTWTGNHTFSPAAGVPISINAASGQHAILAKAAVGNTDITVAANGNAASSGVLLQQDTSNIGYLRNLGGSMNLGAGAQNAITMTTAGAVTVNAPTSGTALTAAGVAGTAAVVVLGANDAVGPGLAVTGQFTGGGSTNLVRITDVNNTNGVNITLVGNGTTTFKKSIRVQSGQLHFINDAYSAQVAAWADNGAMSLNALALQAGAGSLNINSLFFNGVQVQGANPTVSVSTTATNGAAVTYMRSDAAPAIDQGMAPTWTGRHNFNSSEPQAILGTSTGYAWGTGTHYPTLQLAGVGALFGTATTGVVLTGGGLYFNGTSYIYGQAGTGVAVTLGTGTFSVAISTAGTAGQTANPTTVLTVNANGIASGAVTGINFAMAGDGTSCGTWSNQLITTSGTATLRINAFNGTLAGLVPASAGGNVNFLRADGTFATPAGTTNSANPTGTVGFTAVNGVAATFLRSDGAPPISIAVLFACDSFTYAFAGGV